MPADVTTLTDAVADTYPHSWFLDPMPDEPGAEPAGPSYRRRSTTAPGGRCIFSAPTCHPSSATSRFPARAHGKRSSSPRIGP